MRAQTERNNNSTTNMMSTTTPRRILYINTAAQPPTDDDATSAAAFHQIRPSFLASMAHFLQRPQSLPFVLSLFLFLAWISVRMQRASHHGLRLPPPLPEWTADADMMANLARFSSGGGGAPWRVAKDGRGWLLDPVSLATASGISGGAVTCASVHVGEIRPGKLRGNHRHHDCNETFVIWGALTKFRLENSKVADTGYAEVTISGDEIAVAASPNHKAHALVNVDPVRSTFFIGCKDSVINYNASITDFKIWKDL